MSHNDELIEFHNQALEEYLTRKSEISLREFRDLYLGVFHPLAESDKQMTEAANFYYWVVPPAIQREIDVVILIATTEVEIRDMIQSMNVVNKLNIDVSTAKIQAWYIDGLVITRQTLGLA